ncbi:DsbA family protein [Patescibacteria group bacterium]
MEQEQKGLFDVLGPKRSFFFGLALSIMMVATAGFFVFLLGGETLSVSASKTNSDAVTDSGSNTNTVAPTPTAVPTVPSPTNAVIAEITDTDWVKGDRNAPVSVIEYSDSECPFCKRVHPTIQQVVDNYDGQVNWVYRHFPLSSLHQKAAKEAEAAECAGELGGNDGFWAFTDRLYEITPSNDGLLESQLSDIAEYAGIDVTKFEDCLSSGKYTQKIQDAVTAATAAGGQGTPYSVIVSGDQQIPVSGAQPYEQFTAVVDSLL